jgi:hypothetical protein
MDCFRCSVLIFFLCLISLSFSGDTNTIYDSCLDLNSLKIGTTIFTSASTEDGLILYMNFDDSVLSDETPYNHKIIGEIEYGPGHGGRGYGGIFASANLIAIENSAELSSTELTLMFWTFLADGNISSTKTIFHKGDSLYHYTPTLYILETLELKLRINIADVSDSNSNMVDLISTGRLRVRRWTHIGIRISSSLVQIFINGQLDSEKILDSTVQGNDFNLLIGADYLHSGIWQIIDELKIYNVPLGDRDMGVVNAGVLEPSYAYVKLACRECTEQQITDVLTLNIYTLRSDLEGYHVCSLGEIYAFAYHIARISGWLGPNVSIMTSDLNTPLDLEYLIYYTTVLFCLDTETI